MVERERGFEGFGGDRVLLPEQRRFAFGGFPDRVLPDRGGPVLGIDRRRAALSFHRPLARGVGAPALALVGLACGGFGTTIEGRRFREGAAGGGRGRPGKD